MTAPSTPHTAEESNSDEVASAPRVRVLLTSVEGADLAVALAVLGRQVYDPRPEVVVVGADSKGVPEGVGTAETLEQAIDEAGVETDYLWILHSDARPRPDALAALVSEVERNEASLGGSKLLVAGTHNELESVGSATDVFGEPYSGLEEGEIDLQQYDVVREVAFVRSASMLVRRDLAQGLRGLDVLLPPVAAGLDFSQRARLAGGRVISVPSSEVYHQGRCEEGAPGWREQAGRLRAMLTAYRPLTLLWVVPYDFLVSTIDSLANLIMLRWRPAARHFVSWLWNLYHLPSTIGLRRRVRAVRAAGDEELFRFQARGSVRLREVGSEISSRALSLFDEDQALAERGRRLMTSPGIWGAVLAILIAGFAGRTLLFGGVPNVGFSFPFETPSVGFDRILAGWNDSGLGSPAPVHPFTAITTLASSLFLGAETVARIVITALLGVIAIIGMGRLGSTIGLRGPGRYLAGLVLIAGPGTSVLADIGSWTALAAAATLPWVVRAALNPEGSLWRRFGWVLLGGLALAALSPALVVVPLLVAIGLPGGHLPRMASVALVGLLAAAVALPFLLADPGWLVEPDRRLGLTSASLWPPLIAVAAIPMTMLESRWRRPGLLGAFLSVAALAALYVPSIGPGTEEALLVLSSFGAALVTSVGLDAFGLESRRLMAAIVALGIVALSVGTVANGRYGLPGGDLEERLVFAELLAGEAGPGRVLVASAERGDLPGEARPGPGFWYRVVDASGMTGDETWLPPQSPGDLALERAVERIAGGDTLRPGSLLAPFAIDWVVLLGEPFRFDEALVTQLDLVLTPLDPDARVYENIVSAPLVEAADAVYWNRRGTGYGGEPVDAPARIAVNYDPGWTPEASSDGWAMEVDASLGMAEYRGDAATLALALAGPLVGLVGIALIVTGRLRE